jgi:uncharacterized protein
MDPLPAFPYHPDPVATGSVIESNGTCQACRRADGTAAEVLAFEFTDVGVGVQDDVPRAVLEDLAFRTPGFSGWQQEHWLYHCRDAAAFPGADDREATTTYRFRCRHCGTELSYSDSP